MDLCAFTKNIVFDIMHEALQLFKSIIEIPVAWGEMDAAQHVNNTVYLRYGESSRIAYMKDAGLSFDLDGLGIVLAEVNCKYKFPLTFPDTVWVGTRALIDTMDDYGFWTEQIIVSQKYARVSAVLQAKLVSYDFGLLKKTPIPTESRSKILAFESN